MNDPGRERLWNFSSRQLGYVYAKHIVDAQGPIYGADRATIQSNARSLIPQGRNGRHGSLVLLEAPYLCTFSLFTAKSHNGIDARRAADWH